MYFGRKAVKKAVILEITGLNKSFGAKTVLSDLDLKIEDKDRIGLIGENGAGKSTLLNIIAGDMDYDSGTLARGTGKRIGFLRQDSGLALGGTIISEMRSVFASVLKSEEHLRSLEHDMASLEHGSAKYASLFAEYEHEKSRFEAADGYNINVKINTVLTGMGFSSFDPETPVERLSGGERTRLALAKLLLEDPDLLMLDEPTNHLDFKTLGWLEDYISTYKGAILTVSHDRYFLDKIVNTVCEMENKTLVRYNAGYTKYLDLKAARLARMQKEYDRQMREIAELEDFIARNKVRASTTKRAHSREMELERMEIKERPTPPPKPPKFRLSYEREPVKDVLTVEGLRLEVGEGAEKKLLCEADIKKMFHSSSQQLSLTGTNAKPNSLALHDVSDYIAVNTSRHTKTSMKSLLDRFMKAPYGFVEADVQWLVARLFKDGEIAFSFHCLLIIFMYYPFASSTPVITHLNGFCTSLTGEM